MLCKCGTQFHLESYHTRTEGCESVCHRCYSKILPPFTAVAMLNDLTGFNPPTLNICEAKTGDYAVVVLYAPDKQAYAIAAGGFIFWARSNDVKPVHPFAAQHIKEYTAVSPGEYIMKQIQEDVKKYLNGNHT